MISPLPDNWRTQIETLSLDTDTTTEPSGETVEWHQVFMSFATHGFVMLYLQRHANGVQARLEYALPTNAPASRFQDGLFQRLEQLGGQSPQLSTEGPPSVVYATFGEDVSENDIASFLTLCLKISDYIQALDSDKNAALPFDANTAQDKEEDKKNEQDSARDEDTQSDEDGPSEKTAFVFETIGDGTPSEPKEERAATTTPTHSAFESIGTGSPSKAPDDSPQGTADVGDIRLKAYSVSSPRKTIDARLTLTDTLNAATRRTLTQGFIKNMEVRYDIVVSARDAAREDEVELEIRPASSHIRLEERDREDLESYFDRLVRFGRMDVTLAESLDLAKSNTSSRRDSSSRDNTARTTLRDIPSKRGNQQDEEQDNSSGVVLDLSGDSAAPEGNAPLESKRFDDPRIKRPDATTPLVDVVLRHPGYSDKRIGQVLSILLSIDYSSALELIEEAPVVISWGISRERALTFKNAIEGAGGRAILVEPGTFKPS